MSIIAPVTAAASPLRSRLKMVSTGLRWLARMLATAMIAAWSLLLVAWLTLHWGILPHIEQWRPDIQKWAGRALGVPVEVGNISVHSSGWVPSLELRDVVLLDPQGRPALELPHVVASLSPRSLLAFELRFEQLLIDGAHLELRRDAAGHLFVAGLDFSAPGKGDSRAAHWFFAQREFVIRGGSLRWTDEQQGGPPLALTDVQLVVRNTLRRHDMRLDATPPPDWGDRFSLRGRFTRSLLAQTGDWRHWSGQLHAELPRADVGELRRHVKLPFDLREGNGALRAWLDVRDGQARRATVDVALREVTVQLTPDAEPVALEQIQGRLVGQRSAEGMALNAQQFGFVTADGIQWPRSDLSFEWHQREGQPPSGGEFSAQRLDLALIAQIATRVPLGDAVRKLLTELQPRGIVTDLAARWQGALDAPQKYQVKGLLSGLSLAAHPSQHANVVGRPGLHNATIALNASEKGGDAELTVAGGSLELPGVFENPTLPLDQLSTHLQWRIEAPKAAQSPAKVTLQVKDAKFGNADARGELNATWTTGSGAAVGRGGRLPGQLELNGKLTNGVATRVARYLPLGVPEDTRQYVERAVRGGNVSAASFRVKGDLWDFPFFGGRNAKDGEFRIALTAKDLDFAYVPGTPARGGVPAQESPWPSFTKLNGEVIFDRASMEIRGARAQVYGVELTNVQGGIRDLTQRSVLALEGNARGPLADMLRFVNTSPVGAWTDRALVQASGNGNGDLRLALAIPLHAADTGTVKGSLTLAGSDFRLRPDLPPLAAAKGRIDFTQRGFTIVGASARLLGGDASFEGGVQGDGTLRLSGRGTVSAEGLRAAGELGPLSRLAASFSGQTSYRVSYGLVQGHSELSVASNLVGLAMDLPAPLRKAADTALPLRVNNVVAPESLATGQSARDVLRFELGTLLQGQYVRDISAEVPQVLRGGIGLGDAAPNPSAGVAANLNLATLNADEWDALAVRVLGGDTAAAAASSGVAANGYAPTTVALRAQELVARSRRLSKLVAGVSQNDGVWRANVDADQLNGYVEYRPVRGAAGPGQVYARLSRLSLPKNDAEQVETLLGQPSTSLPALDIVVDDLELRGKRLGRVEIDAVNRVSGEGRGAPREWLLSRLTMSMPEAKLNATGQWSPDAGGGGLEPGLRRRAQMDFTLDVADSGALLERLGTEHAIRGGKGRLSGQLSWIGSPLSLDYASMTGRVNVAIDSGQFLKAGAGAARLLSVLSLQSLPRRLALDFRDVFQEGFVFDAVTGDVEIGQGVARTNNLRMRGVQAAVLMEGSADIGHETQDLRVVVVPEINAGTASLAFAAINPAIGLGTFLAQMFLRKPLAAAGTREFRVSGSWADPKVERVERKLGAAATEFDTPQPAKR